MTLEQAAATFPIGAKVKYFPVQGREDFRECEIRSEPWALGHGAIVIKVTGQAGGVSVQHLSFQWSEEACPAHVASQNPKVCARCGVHIDSFRPEEIQ